MIRLKYRVKGADGFRRLLRKIAKQKKATERQARAVRARLKALSAKSRADLR